LPGWSDEAILAIPYARFVQMLRVINQERLHPELFNAWLQGAGGKETLGRFMKSMGMVTRTEPDKLILENDRKQQISSVQNKLGKLYRKPNIQA
jgi:hypothetical protein